MIYKKISFDIGAISALIISAITAYYLLLHDNWFHSSITHVIHFANQLDAKPHLLVLGFLPVYISLMIFGASVLGIYLGSRLEVLILRHYQK